MLGARSLAVSSYYFLRERHHFEGFDGVVCMQLLPVLLLAFSVALDNKKDMSLLQSCYWESIGSILPGDPLVLEVVKEESCIKAEYQLTAA